MLISTNLTKEELYQLLSSADQGKNNTSVDEVETEAISDTETLIKNGKVKFNNRLLNIHINFSNDNLTNRKKFKLPSMDKMKSLHKNKEKKIIQKNLWKPIIDLLNFLLKFFLFLAYRTGF